MIPKYIRKKIEQQNKYFEKAKLLQNEIETWHDEQIRKLYPHPDVIVNNIAWLECKEIEIENIKENLERFQELKESEE